LQAVRRAAATANAAEAQFALAYDMAYEIGMTQRETSAFVRSFANKTSNLTDGKKKNIMIMTGTSVYFITADGYFSGELIKSFVVDGNEEKIKAFWKEFENGTDRGSEVPDSWLKESWSRGRGSRRHYAGTRNGGSSGGYDRVASRTDKVEDISNYERRDWENNGDFPTVTHSHEEVQELLRKLKEIYQTRGYFSLSTDAEREKQRAENRGKNSIPRLKRHLTR
jgi:hypothetical protein